MGLLDFLRGKRRGADANGDTDAGAEITRHCFVLSKSAEPSGLDRAGEVVARVLGPGHSADADEKGIVTITHGEETIGFLAHMPLPIPEGEAEQNADGNFLWPNGKDEAAEHRSHVIVTNVGGSDPSPVESALGVSRLALVALDLFDGLGVYWGNASVCNSREAFEQFCEDMSAEHLPLPMWLRFQAVRAADDKLGMYTLGMQQFGLMDIEVDRSPLDLSELFDFVANLAHYLAQSGPVIADGNTVGGSAEERILVRHRKSAIDPSRRVYKVMFEG